MSGYGRMWTLCESVGAAILLNPPLSIFMYVSTSQVQYDPLVFFHESTHMRHLTESSSKNLE